MHSGPSLGKTSVPKIYTVSGCLASNEGIQTWKFMVTRLEASGVITSKTECCRTEGGSGQLCDQMGSRALLEVMLAEPGLKPGQNVGSWESRIM